MPWTATDAERHTKKASSAKLRAIWARTANSKLSGGSSEGAAVRAGNAAVIAALANMKR